MAGQNYYLITSLPPLGALGSVPPIRLSDLLEHLRDSPAPRAPVEAVLLGDDLLQRQSYLAGEIEQVSPAVLTIQQARDEEPLPSSLSRPAEQTPVVAAEDATWAAYFRWMAAVARRSRNAFLAAWTGHEVALRNAVAAARARALELEPEPYLVAVELGQTDQGFDVLVGEWAGAADPLAGLRVLDRARWTWLNEHDAWFSFADDELAAYATKLMLLHRWHRLSDAGEPEAVRRVESEAS